ncbi:MULTISPECIES: putative mucin/carbohydrate-binding domain-containing protein [Rahnella]|uniref:Peptidase M60 viral enhancin protein n=1 Tax=Rahnella laticis TaxID=2787622 RepID=A0ABS0ECQ3_9GAMM|nr:MULTISPECIES: putative mucin/carbohydrate-binding domain-containing protein [Rahnella]MBF7982782.1 peptidase M60 viral enhancin protein [Rahnella laticis]MBF8002717.1 peptidase M60 viral enhancin protein [Rahnella sp. LAC-M12]
MTTITLTKTLYTLQDPTWLKKAGIDKGVNHDRQSLDMILAAGQTLTIRQTNPKFTAPLTLWLLNADSATEKSYTVTSAATNISFSTTSVPFITTPYSTEAPVLEYSFPGDAKPLPVYNENDDEFPFFQLWDSRDAEFALIFSEFIQILVPKADKAKMKNTGIPNNLSGIIANYKQIFEFYNALMGISFNPVAATDKNIPNRYFAKADVHGAGAAYYSSQWVAATSAKVSDCWLTPIDNNWGALHEIGHGYQGAFMSGPAFSTAEVWNNIFAASFQNRVLGDQVYAKGWLYNYGKVDSTLSIIQKDLADNKPVTNWDLRSKLFFLMQLKDIGGDPAFTAFYQNYRVLANTAGFVATDYLLLDLLSDSYQKIGNVDVTPYIYRADTTLSEKQREMHLFNNGEPAYPLSELVSADQATALKTSLKLPSVLSLVTATQLTSAALKGDLTLTFNIDDIAQIKGEKTFLLLNDASQPVQTGTPDGNSLTFSQIPVGAYKLQTPTGKSVKYFQDNHYAIVKNGANAQTINYVAKAGAVLASQSFSFLGLGGSPFCSLKVDQVKQTVVIDVTSTSPHSYFPGEAYAKVEIYDLSGNIVFTRTMNGDKTTLSHDEVPFSANYRIDIFHAETPSRLKLSPSFAGVINTKSSNNSFTVTPAGLINVSLQNDPFAPLVASIAKQAEMVRANPAMLAAEYASSKDDIFMAVSLFGSPQKEQLLEDYHDVISTHNNLEPDPVILPNSFTLDLQASADGEEFSYEATVITGGSEASAGKKLNASNGEKPSLNVIITDQKGIVLFRYLHQNP